MKIGFTGTQQGLTWAQTKMLHLELAGFEWGDSIIALHHGDCVGADADAHNLALDLGYDVVIHPPIDSRKRAFMKSKTSALNIARVTIRRRKPYIERNHDIVDECDVLVATPMTEHPRLRSGTWATVRYAFKKEKPVVLVLPSGNSWRPKSYAEVLGNE